MEEKLYRAAMYLRLSKEDGDKAESDSIANQKEYIRGFLKEKTDIVLCEERIDDGYSGVHFERPAFQLMLEDIKAGRINCIIVKDLSRFGRNYIETGRYIEKLFPFLGVRFIAINDHYDSAMERNLSDCLLIPFKNLINDEYAKDISIKIRSSLAIKRSRGEFTGSFATYGYIKSKADKNKLEVDTYAAQVVQDIFRWKLSGMSEQYIAEKLNGCGILSPLEYKEYVGLNYTTSFKLNPQAKWSAISIKRILENEVYLGVLVQGKESTPNYKIQKKIHKPKEEWIRVPNHHAAIISRKDFETVQKLLTKDTRVSPGNKKVYLLSGLLSCGDCNHSMVRRTVPYQHKKYVYYICSTNKEKKACSSHRIRNENLETAIFYSLERYLDTFFSSEENLNCTELPCLQTNKQQPIENKKLLTRVKMKQGEIQRYQQRLLEISDDLKAEVITAEEQSYLQEIYSEKLTTATLTYQVLLQEFKNQERSYEPVNRYLAVSLIDTIKVYEGERIHMILKCRDEFH